MNIRMRPELIPYDLQWHRIDKTPPPLDEDVYVWPVFTFALLGKPPIGIWVNPTLPNFTHWRKIIGPDVGE